MTSPFSLEGKTALVTGGNQGLGKAFAFGLAEAGARVAIAGRSEQRNAAVVAEAGRAGHEFLAITADITDDAQVAEMMGSAIDGLGRVDVLVNNSQCQFFETDDGTGLQAIPSGLRPVGIRRSRRPVRMSTSTTQSSASQAEYARTPSGCRTIA